MATRFTDEDGVWLVTSTRGRVLIEPSALFESRRQTPVRGPSIDEIFKSELESATTLAQLKAALIKRFGG